MAGEVTTPTNGNGKAKQKRIHMQDHRCGFCGRLLFRGYVVLGSIVEIRCPRCSRMHTWPEQAQVAPVVDTVNVVARIDKS